MSRRLVPNSRIVTAVNSSVASYTFATWVLVFKMDAASDNNWAAWMNLHTSDLSTVRAGLEKSNTAANRPSLTHGAASVEYVDAITSGDGWLAFGVRKASGTATPRGSLRTDGSGGTWSHGNLSGTLANGTHSDSARMVFGEWQGTDHAAMHLAVAGFWHGVALSDAEIELLWPGSSVGGVDAWVNHSITPTHIWQFNQADPADGVLDLRNNGGHEISADRIGTTAAPSENPSGFSYFTPPSSVTPGPAMSAAAVVRASTW